MRKLLPKLMLALLATGSAAPAAGPPGEGWELVFHDEFNGKQLNWDVWTCECGKDHFLAAEWNADGLTACRLMSRAEWETAIGAATQSNTPARSEMAEGRGFGRRRIGRRHRWVHRNAPTAS